MVWYVHIEYSNYQFSEESKGGWNPTPPPGPCGTEKSVVLRGLNRSFNAHWPKLELGIYSNNHIDFYIERKRLRVILLIQIRDNSTPGSETLTQVFFSTLYIERWHVYLYLTVNYIQAEYGRGGQQGYRRQDGGPILQIHAKKAHHHIIPTSQR